MVADFSPSLRGPSVCLVEGEPARPITVLGSRPEITRRPPTPGVRVSGTRVIAAIETVWEVLQETHPELPDVYVVIDTSGARHNLAWPETLKSDMRPELPVHRNTVEAGSKPVLECLLHLATHALCYAREVPETTNRGMRHNKRFRDVARELGMEWPQGEPPHPSRGFSPIPLTAEAEKGYLPLLVALEKALKGMGRAMPEPPVKGRSGTRITLQCACTPVRTFQIGTRIAAVGPIVCGVCGVEFSEK